MTAETTAPTAEEIEIWLFEYLSGVLDRDPDKMSRDDTFDVFGLDSVEAVIMAGMMEENFAVRVDPILIFDFPTIAKLSQKMAEVVVE